MNQPTHKTAPQTHPISWSFFLSNSNGKEKDYESGFHYYGARYYWSELLTGWLSVDPMSDKYPNISPYAYCMWNPVKLVDPDGKEVDDDWYMTKSGEVKWDKKIKGPNDVPEGGVYLGNNPMIITNQGDNTLMLNPDGTMSKVSSGHGESHGSVSTKNVVGIAIPAILSFENYLWENLTIAVGVFAETAVNVAWMLPASLLFSSDSSPNQKVRGGHDNNVRKSTKGKHEGGDRRRIQDQQGSKGEHMVKGKRPKGYKGPWPPKKKK